MMTFKQLIKFLNHQCAVALAVLLWAAGITSPALAQTCTTSVNWAQANSYPVGSIVKYTDGNLYIAKVATRPGIRPVISTYYWAPRLVCTATPVTPPPVTPPVTPPVACLYPDWIEFKAYQTGDIVKYKEAYYKAAYANPGYIPTVSTFFWKSFSCSEPVTAAVRFHGRFDTTSPGSPRYSWSGSAMTAQFSGTSISVTLNESDARVYYAYVIDDQPVKRFSVSVGVKAYSLATALSNGTHKVLLMRESEGAQAGPSQFMGFSFGGTGQLLAPPQYPDKYRLEFVGDSITAGFGNIGVMPCGFSTETESAYWSYPQQTALLLGEAPATNISMSGIGIYRNYGNALPSVTDPSMPFYYSRNLTTEVLGAPSAPLAPALQPTVVVVNLGTNDFWNGPPSQTDFVAAYVGLLKTIRARYPSAMLIAATHVESSQQVYVQAAYHQMLNSGETKIRFTAFPIRDWSGCSGHPSKAADLEVASFLAQFIRNLGL